VSTNNTDARKAQALRRCQQLPRQRSHRRPSVRTDQSPSLHGRIALQA
jgi:hypothetical protein